MNEAKPITLGSFFDGIGGFPYAGLFYGIKPLWASEILPQAISVTKRHFPDMGHVGDITELDGAKLPPVDIITFGSPCQDLSVAGKREGLSGARSGLFTEAIRIIDEMRRETDGKYPRYALWENVPGALSSSGGLDFKAVLEAFAKSEIPIPRNGKWANAGLVRGGGVALAWRILNACLWGVPQRRRRIFLVADFGGGRAGEILFVEEGLRRHFAACKKAWQEASTDAGGCASDQMPCGVKDVAATLCSGYGAKWSGNAGAYDGSNFALSPNSGCLNPWDTQQARVSVDTGPSPTLAGADGGGGRNPAGLVFSPDRGQEDSADAGEYAAGSAPCGMMAFTCNQRDEARLLGECSGALAAQPGMKQQTFIARHHGHLKPLDTQPICTPMTARTLTARGDGSPCADKGPNMIAYAAEDGLQNADAPPLTMRLRDGCAGGGKGPLVQQDKSGTLATGNDQYLFAPAAVGVHQSQDGSLGMSESAYSLTTSGNASARSAPLVACGHTVVDTEAGIHEGAHPPKAAGVTSKGNGDCFLTPESHGTLSQGGGQAGQGYPAVLTVEPPICAEAAQMNAEINEDLCPMVTEAAGKSGNSKPYIARPVHPEVSGTICASGAGLSRSAGMASEPDLCIAYALQGSMIGRQEKNGPMGSGVSENLSFTLTQVDTPAVASALPIPIHDKATRYKGGGPTRCGDGSGNGLGVGNPGDPSPTVTTGDHHAIAAVFNRQRSDMFSEQDIASTQSARQYKDATDLICEGKPACDASAIDCRNHKETDGISGTLQAKGSPGYSLNCQNPVRTGYIVRRLTPTECERLQGFPDGWTRLGADGEGISDTRRYQMLGNSVAIPCVDFVMSGIAAQIYYGDEIKEDA